MLSVQKLVNTFRFGSVNMSYYAVRNGRNPGVYQSWGDCEEQVNGYSRASYKKFSSAAEAEDFASGGSGYGGGYSGGSGYGGEDDSGGRSYGVGSKAAEVYTDGSCYNNGRSDARAGYGVYWGEGDHRNTSERLSGRQTNNRAEIAAAKHAIEQARDSGYDEVTVKTDSKFLHQSATEWMPRWKQNDWTLSTGGEVKNRSDFEALDDASQGIQVNWEHVPGHRGNQGNEAADRLANQGARKSHKSYY